MSWQDTENSMVMYQEDIVKEREREDLQVELDGVEEDLSELYRQKEQVDDDIEELEDEKRRIESELEEL